jgi:hypothetical protein
MRCLRVGKSGSWGRHSAESPHVGSRGAQADVPVTHTLMHLVEQHRAADRGLRLLNVGAVLFEYDAGDSSAENPSGGLAVTCSER